MAKVRYQGSLSVVSADLYQWMQLTSFAAGDGSAAKVVDFDSTNEAAMFSALESAMTGKSVAVFKPPSKDDMDAVLIGLAKSKAPFGFNFDIQAKYTDGTVQIVHLFEEDATINKVPTRVGKGKKVLLKMEVSLPKADFRHARKAGGKWVDEDDWK